MASTANVRQLSRRTTRISADRRVYEAAVLTGLFASNGVAILHAKNHLYTVALKNMRRVAVDQADLMLEQRKASS